jgi:hypothetical protein
MKKMKHAKPASEAELMQPENDLRSNSRGKKARNVWKSIPFLIMLLPAILIVFLFNYLPIYGVLIAFQDYMPGDDIFSEYTIWVGFENFTRFFSDVQFWDLMKNTFLLCIIIASISDPDAVLAGKVVLYPVDITFSGYEKILERTDVWQGYYNTIVYYDEGIRYLQQTYHIPLILVSMGPVGSRAYYRDMRVEVAPFLQKNTIETTGGLIASIAGGV